MNAKQTFRRAVMFTACGCLVLCLSSSASAIDVMQSALSSKDGHMIGKVQYVIYDKQLQTFSLHLKGAQPDQYFIVGVRRNQFGKKLAWVRADKTGQAIVDLSTKVHYMPMLHAGDVVEVWTGPLPIMKGVLR